MLIIRLARRGKKKHPTYRLIVSEKKRDTRGSYLELLGSFNPHTDPPSVDFAKERIQHWISVGAQASDTVHNLLVTHGVLEGQKRRKGGKQKRKAAEEGGEAAGGQAPQSKKEESSKPAASGTPKSPKTETPEKA